MSDYPERLRNFNKAGQLQYEWFNEVADHIEGLEAKLAKADFENERLSGVLLRISKTEPHHAGQTPNEYRFQKWACAALEVTAEAHIEELKGQDDE